MNATTDQLTAIREAYDNATGSWTGCDWTTTHGPTEIDLDGCSADLLRQGADKIEAGTITDDEREKLPGPISAEQHESYPSEAEYTGYGDSDADERYDADVDTAIAQHAEAYIDDLRSGADWLDQVIANATDAEAWAADALADTDRGDLDAALVNARKACSRETEYGDDPTWAVFRRAIEDAIEQDD